MWFFVGACGLIQLMTAESLSLTRGTFCCCHASIRFCDKVSYWRLRLDSVDDRRITQSDKGEPFVVVMLRYDSAMWFPIGACGLIQLMTAESLSLTRETFCFCHASIRFCILMSPDTCGLIQLMAAESLSLTRENVLFLSCFDTILRCSFLLAPAA